MTRITCSLAILLTLLLAGAAHQARAQDRIFLRGQVRAKGKVKSVGSGVMTITDASGKDHACKIQGKTEEAVSLGGAKAIIKFPAEITIEGDVSLEDLKPGSLVQFRASLNRVGRTRDKVQSLTLFDEGEKELGIQVLAAGAKANSYSQCQISGEVFSYSARSGRLTVTIPPNTYTKKPRLAFTIDKQAKVALESSDYRRAKPGDEVAAVTFVKVSTGDTLIKDITIRLAKQEATTTKSSRTKRVANNDKYRNLSDAPKPPRTVQSPNFVLHTDISDRSARILLDKLETMIVLVSTYYGRKPRKPIQCYVVRDLKNWQGRLPASAAIKIAEPAGVTVSSRVSDGSAVDVSSIVYSCDKHGVVQHEAVHAYCNQTFGSAGPTWYAEGMAEMGQYWKKGERAVNVDPVVIDYLKNAEPKKMLDIVAAGQITGDSWQAYSWRWALCHLLASNPNYSGRFKGLGMAMMSGQNATFESVYGPVAAEISFEYDQFVKHLDNGYRSDLCAWQWNRKFPPLGSGNHDAKVIARYGWQAASVRLEKDQSYDYAARGEWKTSPKTTCDADGGADGFGKLMGVLLSDDYQLSEPFEIGARSTHVAPISGRLYVRCKDDWTKIADNSGELKVYVRRSPKQ